MLAEAYSPYSEYYSGPNHLFLQRAGSLPALPTVDQIPLDDTQKEAVFAFENELFDTQLGHTTIGETLAKDSGQDVHALRFCFSYFQDNPDAITTFAHENNLAVPQEFSDDAIAHWFYGQSFRVDSDELRKLSQKSIDYATEQLVAPIMRGDLEGFEHLTDHVTTVINPEDFVRLCEDMTAVRKHIFSRWRTLRQTPQFAGKEDVWGKRSKSEMMAELAILDVYLAKTNSKIAELRALSAYLIDAENQLGTAFPKDLADRLHAVIPRATASGATKPERRQRQFARLDAVRNGLSFIRNEEGEVTQTAVVDPKLYRAEVVEADVATESVFTPEETEALKRFMLSPEEMVEIVTEVIQKAGLLSQDDQPYIAGESTPASDGAWRVAVSPLKATFSIQRPPRVYLVSKQPRSLYDLITVGGAHEMRHIDQERASIQLAGKLAIANVGGKRMSALTEGDANAVQQTAEADLFGEHKDGIRTTFADALQVLQKDPQALAQAALAFYQALARYGKTSEASARTAVDRVLRLARFGQDSQPLSYAEGGLMARTTGFFVSEAPITTFDLPDQHRLHRFGLLPESSDGGSLIPWYQIMLEVAEPYIKQALATTRSIEDTPTN